MSALAEAAHFNRLVAQLAEERKAWLRLNYGMRLADWPRAAEIAKAEQAAYDSWQEAKSQEP